MSSAKPFIIWTLQRTGGTNLAMRLFERSGLLEHARVSHGGHSGAEWLERIPDQWKLHEPFNFGDQGRVFGEITVDWIANQNRQALASSIADICRLQLPMKHCVEMVPWEVSETLAEQSTKAGYRHLFLYRRDATSRLLSLQFATLSGIWGRHFRDGVELNDRIFAEPLPVSELVEHERKCSSRLDQAWRLLEKQAPLALAYEDVYLTTSLEQPARALLPVLSELGLARGRADDNKFVAATVLNGDQGTRTKYGAFSGVDVLEQELAQLVPVLPEASRLELDIEPLPAAQQQVMHAVVDNVPSDLRPGRMFALGGVVVLRDGVAVDDAELSLVAGGEAVPVTWGIRSPAIEGRFDGASNSGHARFRTGWLRVEPDASWTLRLADNQGGEVDLFRVRARESAAR